MEVCSSYDRTERERREEEGRVEREREREREREKQSISFLCHRMCIRPAARANVSLSRLSFEDRVLKLTLDGYERAKFVVQ